MSFGDLDITVRVEGQVAHLGLSGELDLATAEKLRETVERVRRAGAHTVMLDVTGLGFMDSSGLNLFLKISSELRGDGGRLRISALPPRIARTMRLANIEHLLDLDSAV